MAKATIAFAFVLASTSSLAGRVQVTTTVDALHTFSEQAGFDGDVAVQVANPVAGCKGGFWLRSADTRGYKSTLAFLVTALQSGKQVSLSGLDDQVWTGASQKYCRLDQISITK